MKLGTELTLDKSFGVAVSAAGRGTCVVIDVVPVGSRSGAAVSAAGRGTCLVTDVNVDGREM